MLVDALDHLPDSTLVDQDDWVQLRTPSSQYPNHNVILRARFTEDDADRRIDEALAEHAERGAGLRWVVDADSRPADLAERLTARGLPLLSPMVGMVRAVEGPPYPALPAGVRIVRVTEDDCERLGEIVSAGWERSAAYGRAAAELAQRAFAEQDDQVAFWLAYDGPTLVGSSMLRVLPGVGYLQGGSVIPAARGRGIYRALTWARIAELHRRGLPAVVIWANPDTSGPVARSLGFSPVTEAPLFEWHADDP